MMDNRRVMISFIDKNIIETLNIVNKVVGVLLILLGIIGNGIGVVTILISNRMVHELGKGIRLFNKDKLSINQYLLCIFFGVNFLNSLLMIVSPVLKLFCMVDERDEYAKWWWDWCSNRPWAIYWAHYHQPLFRPLIAFGLLVYFLYFSNQTVAVLAPMFYRRYANKRNVNIILCIVAACAYVWYIPSYRWFDIKSVTSFRNVCHVVSPSDTSMIDALNDGPDVTGSDVEPMRNNESLQICLPSLETAYTFVWNLKPKRQIVSLADGISVTLPSGKIISLEWEDIYNISRELCLTIVPFLLCLLTQILALKRSRNMIRAMSPEVYDNLVAGKYILGSGSQIPRPTQSSVSQRPVVPMAAWNRAVRRLRANEQHKKTLVILTGEFVCLIIPVTIFNMALNQLFHLAKEQDMSTIYVSVTLLQFVYVSCTFYINATFNSAYRRLVSNSLSTLVRNVKANCYIFKENPENQELRSPT